MPTPAFIKSVRAKIGTELLQVPTVSVLAYDDDGRLLMVRDKETKLWVSPGGIVEPHEIPSDAAVRETWEETGVLVRLTRIVGVFGGEHCSVTYGNGDRLAWVATVFEARVTHGAPRADDVETCDAGFFSPIQLQDLPCKPHLRLFVDAARRSEHSAYFKPPTWGPSTA
jgi:8-oxo-dGTP pyrophosphatase MutT (NUDIX family)